MSDPSKERTCFNCAYGEIRCTNARGKFFDKPVLDILICGAWREKDGKDKHENN